MNVMMPICKKNMPYAVVMLTSLGINCKEHVDVFVGDSDLLEEEFSFVQSAVVGYNITVHRCACNDDKAVCLDYDMIINKPLSEDFLADEQGMGILSAWDAHIAGVTYEEIRDGATVIQYEGSKPWENSGFHYDIERLWWDYAKKTSLYNELLTSFVKSAFEDNSVEDYLKGLISETSAQRKRLEKMMGSLNSCPG